MRYTLKDYQHEAYVDVREKLDDALIRWQSTGQRSSLSLTTPTRAGKTVIAAAVIESNLKDEAARVEMLKAQETGRTAEDLYASAVATEYRPG